jgi:hypothetical protein
MQLDKNNGRRVGWGDVFFPMFHFAILFLHSEIRDEEGKKDNKDNQDNKELEGPGRPLNPPRKMLIVTTPGGQSAATPLERGNSVRNKIACHSRESMPST